MTSRSHTLAEIARKSSLTESTARRYTRLFAEFIPSEDRGRLRLFSADCVPVLKRIKALYDTGHSSDQVRDVLNREFDRTVDIEVAYGDDRPPADSQDLAEQIVSAIQRNAQAGHDIDKLKKAVKVLRDHVVSLRGEQRALPDSRTLDQVLGRLDQIEGSIRRLEARVQELEDERSRSWWARLRGK